MLSSSILAVAVCAAGIVSGAATNGPAPGCVSKCWEYTKYVSLCGDDMDCLCDDGEYQGAVYQCLYSQCHTAQFANALHHTLGMCSKNTTPKDQQDIPALIRQEGLKNKKRNMPMMSNSVSASVTRSAVPRPMQSVNRSAAQSVVQSARPRPSQSVNRSAAQSVTMSARPRPSQSVNRSAAQSVTMSARPRPTQSVNRSAAQSVVQSARPRPSQSVNRSAAQSVTMSARPRPSQSVAMSARPRQSQSVSASAFTRTFATRASPAPKSQCMVSQIVDGQPQAPTDCTYGPAEPTPARRAL